MARRSQPQEEPSTLRPEQAIPILENLIREGEDHAHTDRDSPKVTQWAETTERALAAALGSQHKSVHAFGREFHSGVYYPHDSPARLQQQFLEQLANSLAILKSAVEQLRWTLPDPKQVFFPAGTQHDAYREIRDIVTKVTNEIVIVDPYVDQSLWTLLTNVPPTVRIRVLTDKMQGDFLLEAKKFTQQRGNPVEVRLTTNYHDRFLLRFTYYSDAADSPDGRLLGFRGLLKCHYILQCSIVLDSKDCWHLGASIKDAGGKAFAISKFERPELLNFAISDMETVWNGAQTVSL